MFEELKVTTKKINKVLNDAKDQLNDRLAFRINESDIDKVFDNAFEQLDKTVAKMDEMFDSDLFKTATENVNTILSFSGATPTFPPMNIYSVAKAVDPVTFQLLKSPLYVVELALSGYKSEDVDVNIHGAEGSKKILVIESKGINERKTDGVKFYQRGIAGRAFKVSVELANNVKVASAKFADGMLRIDLTTVPDVQKPTVEKVPVSKG
jgi:HSP20 family molecular chaperone IbpA